MKWALIILILVAAGCGSKSPSEKLHDRLVAQRDNQTALRADAKKLSQESRDICRLTSLTPEDC